MGLEENCDRQEEEEFEASLTRTFVDRKADYIIVDGHDLRNKFLRECIQYGIDEGLLYKGEDLDEDDILGSGVGQSLAYTYRLTDKGKEYFDIPD